MIVCFQTRIVVCVQSLYCCVYSQSREHGLLSTLLRARHVATTETERPCCRPMPGVVATERLAEADSTSSLRSLCSRPLWPIQAIAKQRPAVTILRYGMSTLKDVLGKRLLQVP
jgi:hypothetical protein